ncbi:MAG: hypothetical protein RLZZ292_1684, partial [Bacteroidota bacterium]
PSPKGREDAAPTTEDSHISPPLEGVGEVSSTSSLPFGEGWGGDFIQVEPKYQALVDYLLKDVYIVENDHFLEQKDLNLDENIVLLSKNGTFTKRRFAISGGSVGLFEGKKIGRKKNLEFLEKNIKELDIEAADLNDTLVAVRKEVQLYKVQQYTPDIQRQQEQFNRGEREKVALKTRLDGFTTFATENDAKNEVARQNIAKIEDDNQLIINHIAAKKGEEGSLHLQISMTDQTYSKLADALTIASQEYNEKNIAFIRQQNKVGNFQRELTFREKQRDESQVQLQNNQRTLAQSDSELLQNQTEIDALQEGLKVAYTERKTRESTLSQAEQDYYQARNGINTLEDTLRKLNRQQQDLQSLVNRLKDKFGDVKLQMTSIGERLQVEFKISINDIINQEPEAGLNRVELETQVEKLKNRLENYGEINPMAVTAYNEMSERHTTIIVQRDDILTAKNSLMETIKEIEETAIRQFLASFEQIRVNFIEVFRSLFTSEDTCDLILENPANPLESPINIIAKPKGKRPQSISQLSGGEKTLTATALLFALYLLKPAPFCIFDEVDAPLDDANIEKFNRIIKKFSSESQFIIVTHNKATMAAVDVIYGVFMQEMGVSAVAPVDFRNLENTSVLQKK